MKKSRSFVITVLCAVLCVAMLCACKPKDPVYRLSTTDLELGVGDTATISVSVTPKKEFSCTFVSYNTAVVTVEQNGLVTAHKAGTAVIEVLVDEMSLFCNVTVTDVVTNHTVTGRIENVTDGGVSGATVTVGSVSATTEPDGSFSLVVAKSTADVEPKTLTVQKAGYVTKTMELDALLTQSAVAIESIELVRNAVIVGTLADNSFSLYTTRSTAGLHLIATTGNSFWRNNQENAFRIMISTKDNPVLSANTYVLEQKASGHTFLQDRGDKHRSFEVGDISITRKVALTELTYEYVIPFDKFGLSANEVIGLAMTTTFNSLTGAMKSAVDGALVIPNLTTSFVRVGADNLPFSNEYNCTVDKNPTVPYDKAALTQGKTVRFALPGVAHKNADDIWVGITKTSNSFRFDMVGFGNWTGDELIRIVLHVGDGNGTAWGLYQTDVSVLCAKTTAVAKTNLTTMHAHNSLTDGTALATKPVFEQKSGYFVYSVEVLFSEIPSYSAQSKVRAMFMEVLNNSPEFYNVDWWVGSLLNGNPCGDNAMQANYVTIQ